MLNNLKEIVFICSLNFFFCLDDVHKMIVTWSSINYTDSFVIYGLTRTMLNMTQKGYSEKFVDGGSLKLSQFIHKVELGNLKPNTTYCKYYGI